MIERQERHIAPDENLVDPINADFRRANETSGDDMPSFGCPSLPMLPAVRIDEFSFDVFSHAFFILNRLHRDDFVIRRHCLLKR